MSEFDLTEDVEPDETPDAEEYEANEQEAVSEETGTVYDGRGEPAVTPQDLERADEDGDDEE
ncbi:hypothetical protein [Nocardioides sp.]|uniref:hypothetical protein n=1 Tax=Nocardioides sp. TaxID=35761 RepID=UPI002ED7898A